MRALIVAAALACSAAPAAAAPAPETSWGKAGVTLADYRMDATRCQQLVLAMDLSGTSPARALVTASRRIETAWPGGGPPPGDALGAAYAVSQAVQQARPAHRWRQVRNLMQTAMDACLTELGYRRFRLTEEQRDRLRHLRYGGDERRAYLHGLASDPEVLARQGE